MKIYMAPMEGITNHIYRRAYHRWFSPVDRCFAPFLTNTGLNHKERADLLPENNEGIELIPQILTNRAEAFLELAKTLRSFGYTEVNLNLGCPSGTVTAKGRGAGFLRDLPRLERFLDEIFDRCPLQISVKTRIGYDDEAKWPAVWALLNRYPFSEIIIHPRLRTDFYRGSVRQEAFAYAYESVQEKETAGVLSLYPCYNGDIYTVADYETMRARFPQTPAIMLGRGLITNPGLAGELRGQPPMTRDALAGFLQELEEGYCAVMSGERNILCRLLEMWSYLSASFDGAEKLRRRLRKASGLTQYEQIVKELLV